MSEWRGSNRLFNGWMGSRLVARPLPADRSSVPNKPVVAWGSLEFGQWVVVAVIGVLCSLPPAKRRALPETENHIMAVPKLAISSATTVAVPGS